jgi:CheY-like chemotaxis protein
MGAGTEILIIDDDKDLVNSVRIVLESKGFQVRAAYNGKEGYERIQERRPDLIILDVMMSTDTEGFDFAYKLRNNPEYRDTPIVMTTGFPKKMAEQGTEKFQHIMGEGWPVSQFLEKPIDPIELIAAVEACLKEAGKG